MMIINTREKFLDSIRVDVASSQSAPLNILNNKNSWNNNGGTTENKGVPTEMYNSLDNR